MGTVHVTGGARFAWPGVRPALAGAAVDPAFSRVALLLAAVLAASCGGGGNDPVAAAPVGGTTAPAPAPSSSSPASGCYDLSPAKGKTIQRSQSITFYNFDGSVQSLGSDTQTAVVGDLVAFEGNQAVETNSTGSSTDAQGNVIATYTGSDYSRQTGPMEVTEYGFMVHSTVQGGMASSKLVFSPPFVNQGPGMTPGQQIAYTSTSITTTTVNAVAQPPIQSTQTHTARYVGMESLAIAAGAFNACKFEVFDSPGGPVDTLWFLVGHGIKLKYVQPATPGIGGGFVRELTSILINGSQP